MDLKILWMYHDLMDLYGDKGNIETLRYRASKRGIDVVVDTCTLQEEISKIMISSSWVVVQIKSRHLSIKIY